MAQWIGIGCGLLVLALAVPVLRAYLRYRRSPEKRWRNQVLWLEGLARRRAQLEYDALRSAGVEQPGDDAALRQQAFRSYLAKLPVHSLEAYAGIGPATITRLRDAGYRSLADLDGALLDVPGLGQKRLADVTCAVRDEIRQARGRFDAGACPEARGLDRQLELLRASRSEQGFRAAARYQAVLNLLDELAPLADLARHINFAAVVGQVIDPANFLAVLQRGLPDLEATVGAADEAARQAYAARRPVAPVAIPVRGGGPADAPAALPVRAGDADLFRAALDSSARADAPSVEDADAQQLAALELTVRFAFCVARADGRVARKEKEVIDEHLQRRYGHDPALFNRARAFCAQYEAAAIDVDDCLARLAERLPVKEREELLNFAHAIAAAAGDLNQREIDFLDRAARRLGVASGRTQPEHPPPAGEQPPLSPAPPADPRALLEIGAELPLTADLVRRQYNQLTERYNPERVAAMGAEFVQMAADKRAAVRAAALALLEPMGEPLEVEAPPAPTDLRHNPDLDAIFGE